MTENIQNYLMTDCRRWHPGLQGGFDNRQRHEWLKGGGRARIYLLNSILMLGDKMLFKNKWKCRINRM